MNAEISATSAAAPVSRDVDRPHGQAPAPTSASSRDRVVVIRPSNGWQPINASELWRFRELLGFLVWRDVKVRYKQTLLGAAWAVLQPALMMIVFTIFFGRMAGVPTGGLPYPVFVYMGLLPWTFFSTAVANSGNSVVGSERLITKVYFPRLAIPFASAGACLVDFLIAFALLVLLMCWYRVVPGVTVLILPLVLGSIALMAVGVGTGLAALNVKYRDFRYIIPFLVQFWMFATPTIYMQPSNTGGHGYHALLALNPMTGLVAAFRAACSGGAVHWGQLAVSAACALALFLLGCLYFRRAEQHFADTI